MASLQPSHQTTPARITYGILLALALLLLGSLLWPIWQALLLAAVLAAALGRWHDGFTRLLGHRPRLSAALFTVGVILLILAPIGAVLYYAILQAIGAVQFIQQGLQSGGMNGLLSRLPDSVEGPLRHVLGWIPGGLQRFSSELLSGGQAAVAMVSGALSTSSHVVFQGVLMLVTFYFLLVDGRRLIEWGVQVLPLQPRVVRECLQDIKSTAKSLLSSTLATALLQSVVATAGYFIARVPQALFFGLLTFFAAFIPSVGTAIVAVPLCGLMLLTGHSWAALFLFGWWIVFVVLADNFIRPLLLKGGMRLHSALVFFSLIGGVAVLGGIGLVAGPLILTFFLSMVRLGRRDFSAEETTERVPPEAVSALPPAPAVAKAPEKLPPGPPGRNLAPKGA
jgi:predicted PurR-regulated permease PerM